MDSSRLSRRLCISFGMLPEFHAARTEDASPLPPDQMRSHTRPALPSTPRMMEVRSYFQPCGNTSRCNVLLGRNTNARSLERKYTWKSEIAVTGLRTFPDLQNR